MRNLEPGGRRPHPAVRLVARARAAGAARGAWRSITPEPERELPRALATLAAGGHPDALAVQAEARRIQQLVLAGGRRRWLEYLSHAVSLIERRAGCDDPAVAAARRVALEVLRNHHNLMLGLPGRRPARADAERRRLDRIAVAPRAGNLRGETAGGDVRARSLGEGRTTGPIAA
jgi:hypothetical protein